MKEKLLKTILYYIFPFLWAFGFVCGSFIPERLFQNFHQVLPLVLIVIFYYAIFSPRRLNVFMVFILGLLADLLSSSVLGLNAFIYVAMFFMANLLQAYVCTFSFKQLWIVFCILMFICDVICAWLARLSTGVWVSASFWLVQYVFICLCYPVVLWITGKLNHYLKDV